ncbi:hypothetical protein DQ04_10351000 [Trypanosoma grayi]|uniref:hypothetical protein n=1 Tax=Trypanosoma grayi TaxID=71804 RepID=UPI0004F47E6B|nr:hypothetical protein DQ04_10351000 [Trypanosoma grayi]KEG07271.1 hypothetical protein DQ04_10351000 [Trypanosoma grayi]
MLNSFLGSNSNSIGKLCASSSTTVNEVLARDDLLSYLQMQRDDDGGTTAVLGFVDRCVSTLIEMALRSSSPKERSPIRQGSKWGRANESTNCPSGLLNTNAVELIVYHMDLAHEPQYMIVRIVPATIAVLGNTDAMTPLVSRCFQRILLGAFDVDPIATTTAIASVLDEQIIHGAVQKAATNFIVADTIVALFGSALRASSMVSPETRTQIFTEAWIQLGFPQLLASYMSVALRTKDHQPYFYFLKELLKRGFSHSAGPVVDVLLRYEVMSEFVRVLLEACEEARTISSAVPLAAQGVEVLHSIIVLVRRSLIPLDTRDMYTANVIDVVPIKCLKIYAKRFGVLIGAETEVNVYRVNGMQVALCEVFLELLRFRARDTDEIITESGYLEGLVTISVRHPECNRLSMLLREAILSVFSEDQMNEDNIILKHLKCAVAASKRNFLSGCLNLCATEALRNTSLSAFMIDACRTLVGNRQYTTEPLGLLRRLLGPFLANPAVQKRMNDMERPITGVGFDALGSACQGKVQHRPLNNHTGRQLCVRSDSLASPCGKEFFVGVPGEPAGEMDRAGAAYVVEAEGVDEDLSGDLPQNDVDFSANEALLREGEDTVTVDMEWVDEAVEREASPQVRAYPKFCDMFMSFEAQDANFLGEARDPTAAGTYLSHRTNSAGSADGDAFVHEAIVTLGRALHAEPER